MATQDNVRGSPFHCVDIYRCRSNGASNANFLFPDKNACDVGNGHQAVLTTEEGCIFMRLNRIHINCVSKGW